MAIKLSLVELEDVRSSIHDYLVLGRRTTGVGEELYLRNPDGLSDQDIRNFVEDLFFKLKIMGNG